MSGNKRVLVAALIALVVFIIALSVTMGRWSSSGAGWIVLSLLISSVLGYVGFATGLAVADRVWQPAAGAKKAADYLPAPAQSIVKAATDAAGTSGAADPVVLEPPPGASS